MHGKHTSTVIELSSQKEVSGDDDYTKWAKQVGAPFAGGPIEFANMQLWDKPAPEQEWAVLNHIPLGSVTGFYGEGGMGKSTAAKQLAVACVAGQRWFGLPVKQGAAIYVGSEDDEDALHRRLELISASSMHTPSALSRMGLHVASYAGRNMMLARVDEGRMTPTELYYRLFYRVMEVRPVIVVLDPLNDIYPGDFNSPDQVSEFMGLLRQIAVQSGAAVMINAHPSQEGVKSGSGTSGTTAWHGKFRARLYLRPDPKERNARILEFKKNQYAARGESIRLRFENGIFVVDAQPDDDPANPSAADQHAEQVFLRLLDRFDEAGRKVCDKVGTSYAPARFADEPEAKAARLNRKAIGAAMSRLFAARLIRVVTEGPPSKQRSRIVRA